ncbi:MAG: polymer-forming cytoskeletal protein [Geminicoccaceae bacterium]|nr:MAG: polymer-forming cytoskeletal protein [Geminicoccaceae bacterium]
MFRRRDPAAPPDVDAPSSATPSKVELPRRVLDVPVGPSAAASVSTGAGRSAPAETAASVVAPRPVDPAPSRQLTVGEGIKLAGQISACDRLTVYGEVEASLERSHMLDVAKGGTFDGKTEVEEADIAGHVRGELTVTGRLLIRSTGVVEGTIRFGELEIERGGQLRGNVAANEAERPAPRLTSLVNAAGGQAG